MGKLETELATDTWGGYTKESLVSLIHLMHTPAWWRQRNSRNVATGYASLFKAFIIFIIVFLGEINDWCTYLRLPEKTCKEKHKFGLQYGKYETMGLQLDLLYLPGTPSWNLKKKKEKHTLKTNIREHNYILTWSLHRHIRTPSRGGRIYGSGSVGRGRVPREGSRFMDSAPPGFLRDPGSVPLPNYASACLVPAGWPDWPGPPPTDMARRERTPLWDPLYTPNLEIWPNLFQLGQNPIPIRTILIP